VNFLEMVQELVLMGGITGQGGPSTVTGQTGEYGRAVAFIRQANDEVCGMHPDWGFLWAHDEQSVADPVIDPPSGLETWAVDRLQIDNQPLAVLGWSEFVPTNAVPTRPYWAIIRPDNRLQLHPAPDKDYTLSYDYWITPPRLTEDTDVSPIPQRFHAVVVGRALILLGNYEFAEDLMKQGQELYQLHLESLQQDQLPGRQQALSRQEGVGLQVIPQ